MWNVELNSRYFIVVAIHISKSPFHISAAIMDLLEAKRIIEGVLFIAGEPVTLKRLKEVLVEVEPQTLRQLIDQLNAEYAQTARAFLIQEVAGGYQLATDPKLASWMKRAFALPKEDSLSKAALETLAMVAYRQPMTKAEIEAIRGVDTTAVLDTLLERQFVRIAGRKETPGRPFLYGTTDEFLKHFGLNSLEDLPKVSPESRAVPGFDAPTIEPQTAQQPTAQSGLPTENEPASPAQTD
jgi:segregation and condensation protein B